MDAYSFRAPSAATHTPSFLLCSNFPLGQFLRQPFARLFPSKETGASHTAAVLLAWGFAAFPLVTIGVTNTECSPATAMPIMVPQPKKWTAPD
jgi:hypothetical protein